MRREGRTAVTDGAIAGYRSFLNSFRKEYRGRPPNDRRLGAPNGRAYYIQKIREFTHDRSEAEESKAGLAKSRGSQPEMNAVMKQAVSGGTSRVSAVPPYRYTFYAKTRKIALARLTISKKIEESYLSLQDAPAAAVHGQTVPPGHRAEYTTAVTFPHPGSNNPASNGSRRTTRVSAL